MAVECTTGLSDGRTLGFDDVGDPRGRPVLYVHGTPDSRRSRHPDDSIARRLGVRLIAVDRPGTGLSTLNPAGTLASFADDAVALADHLDVDAWRSFGWSAGGPFALAVAARHPDRVERVAVAAGLVPFEAYAEPGTLDGADAARVMVAELGAELGPTGFAEATAPMLAPHPCDLALAREHLVENASPLRRGELQSIPGLIDAMAAGLVDSASQGLTGIVRDLELQVVEPDVDWAGVGAPVDLWYASRDTTASHLWALVARPPGRRRAARGPRRRAPGRRHPVGSDPKSPPAVALAHERASTLMQALVACSTRRRLWPRRRCGCG